MPSYSGNILLIEPTVNSTVDANLWGGYLNTDMQLVDDYTAGTLVLSVAGNANVQLTSTQGASDQSRRARYSFTGILTGNITVFWPNALGRMFSVANNTTGAFTLTCASDNGSGSPAGTTVVIPQGGEKMLGTNGTDMSERVTSILFAQGLLQTLGGNSNPLVIKYNEAATATRTLSLVLHDADRTIDMSGGLTVSSGGATVGGTSSGTNTGDQTITLTGDVTGSGTASFAATVAAHAVSNSKLAQIAAHSYKGNNTGSTADASDITNTQLTADLDAMVGDSGSGGTKGLVPAPGAGDAAANKFLKADATWAAQATVFTHTFGNPVIGGSVSTAHGMSSRPRIVLIYLVNTSTELGFSIGDQVQMSVGAKGCNPWADGTNVGTGFDNAGFQIFPKTGGTWASINTTKWNVMVVAYQ